MIFLKWNTIPAFLLCFTCLLQGCSDANERLEQSLAEELIQHREDKVLSVDLRMIFGTEWSKSCLQGPYEIQADFERKVEKKVPGFIGISDDRYAIWVFYLDGHTSRVEIERVRVMEYLGKGTSCTSFQNPFLYLETIGGNKYYYFNDI